jgi:hypothetical protein
MLKQAIREEISLQGPKTVPVSSTALVYVGVRVTVSNNRFFPRVVVKKRTIVVFPAAHAQM